MRATTTRPVSRGSVLMITEISIGMDSALDRGGAVAIVVRVKQTFYQLRGGLQGPEVNVRRV